MPCFVSEVEKMVGKLGLCSDMDGQTEATKEVINSNEVVIFAKSYCPHCRATKKLFAHKNVHAKIVDLDLVTSGRQIQNALKSMTGQRTVPYVFIAGDLLGGNDVTQKAERSGELDDILRKAHDDAERKRKEERQKEQQVVKDMLSTPISRPLATRNPISFEEKIQREIQKHEVVIFSKSYCLYCAASKKLFQDKEVHVHTFELDRLAEGSKIQDALAELTGQTTVPFIFVGGEHVGGNDKVQAAEHSGKLDEWLFREGRGAKKTAEEVVKDDIESSDVVIYSKSYCPYCWETKDLFGRKGVDARIIELDEVENGDAIQEALVGLTGQRTVPNVFIKGRHMIGGNDAVQDAEREGTLDGILTAPH